ncbi:MAG: RHS repeat domain-containing protein, partial [Cytophaga sp.]|uniref:RHS repeat domain-containing protein n=1 Tax=Cytophaga sp. TaxID=29535 RepID=UPI003F7EFB67
NGLNSAPLSFKTQKQYDASPVANTVIGILNNSQSTNYGGLTSLNYLVDYNLIEYSTTTVYNILNASGGTIATRQRRNVWNQAALTSNKAGYTTAYSYDNEGRLEWMAQTLPTLGSKTMDYVYDENNRLLQSIYQKNDASDRFIHIYTYDKIGRLKTTSTRESNGLVKLHEKNSYYLHGPLKRRELGESLQGVDYVYTIQGWLKGINHPEMNTAKDPGKDAMAGTPNAGFTADVFGMSLDYFDGDYSNGTVAYATPGDMHSSNYGLIGLDGVTQSNMYNGTIRSVLWQTSEKLNTGNYPNQMSFNYDSKYQLKTGFYGVQDLTTSKFVRTNPDTYLTGVSYDLNGNIIGKLTYKTAGTESLFYNYVANTNKLASVQLVSAAFRTYLYNAIGQMTQQTDADGKVKKLKYNTAGQVIEIKNGNDVVKVTYEYNERGQKVKKLTYSGGVLTNTTWYVLDASGNIVSLYDTKSGSQQQAEIPVYSSARIGVVYKNGSALTFTYELKDHLGNVRATINRIRKSPGKADVVSWADYFPFGEVIPDRHFETAGLLSRFGYQGDYCEAEMDETGWNDFDLRMYDPVIGRWLSRDPYNQYHSPYVGMGNDPMNGVDPDGGYKTRFGAWTAGLVSGIKNFKVDYEEGRGYYYQRNDVTENYGGTFDPELGWVYGDIEVYPRYFESDNHSVIGFFDKHANYVMGIGPILALKALQALKNSHGTTYTNNSGLSLPTPVGNYKGYTSSTTGSTNLFQTNVTTFNGIYDNTEHTLNLRIVTVGTNSDGAILASVNAGFIAVQVEAGLPGVTLDVNTTNIWGETRGTEITIDPKSVGGAAALLRGRRPSYAP